MVKIGGLFSLKKCPSGNSWSKKNREMLQECYKILQNLDENHKFGHFFGILKKSVQRCIPWESKADEVLVTFLY